MLSDLPRGLARSDSRSARCASFSFSSIRGARRVTGRLAGIFSILKISAGGGTPSIAPNKSRAKPGRVSAAGLGVLDLRRDAGKAASEHAQLPCRGERQVEHASPCERAAVVDNDLDAAACLAVGDLQPRAERQRPKNNRKQSRIVLD